ncbi:hypothetical protein LZZ85_11370 [Terrimonas sp. NA20]|uniref:Uncharacterized protein n=1 Tax=Terrimonas ginsenosidimutans TaxID=2908004 RepID=A0ABS9KRD6_9BACT|nr:hypothetical protein [Terrimonas ginsenosidimutans]MCG2614888.1 hypothetical protein [Terrimonas ginsenosidimutans]
MAETFTQKQYETLCAAIAQGALRVKYGDKEVDYRNLDDMLRTKALMEKSLGIGKKKSPRKYLTFKRGF